MQITMSAKLTKLIELRDGLHELIEAQLIDDFVAHLVDEHAHDTTPRKGKSILKWLGKKGGYAGIVGARADSRRVRRNALSVVTQVMDVDRFAEKLGESLNDQFNEGNAGYLVVRPVDHESDEDQDQTLVTFKYDEVYWWGD